jgi:hypothetical protein
MVSIIKQANEDFRKNQAFSILLKNHDEMKGETHVSKELDEQTGGHH